MAKCTWKFSKNFAALVAFNRPCTPTWRKQGWIPRSTISWWKASIPPQKESWVFFWTFSFHFFSFNGVFKPWNAEFLPQNICMVIVRQPFCWKWISVTKVSKYGKGEYSGALNASYTFQPFMSLWCNLMFLPPFICKKGKKIGLPIVYS